MERHLLHQALEEMLGADHAATLMAFLPPVPWHVLSRHGVYPPKGAHDIGSIRRQA